jgi:hypothetical protein
MELKDLTTDEEIVLVGFLREIVIADGDYTEEESDEIRRVRDKMGPERFDAAIAHVRERAADRHALKELAKTVERKDARKLILDTLIHLSAVDGVDGAEERPLRWLVSYWS